MCREYAEPIFRLKLQLLLESAFWFKKHKGAFAPFLLRNNLRGFASSGSNQACA
ncbi:hypothetical Protein YC6258_05199 [Gynuella sunshinyii YC6258]|uniref:Uncharacterized protein n=1 Tax=Gynuella sunshinyii YC6258 TaxID=1445510 RepID=A0A0C5W3N4_9GAMM|nr:hypothetical Protein YC6258_05199 [Gynuella sunshinyii YC6258]